MLPDIDALKNHGSSKPSEPKVDRLAAYNHHRVELWSTVAEFCNWHAQTITDMSELDKAVHVWRQVSGIVGVIEQA